MRLLHALLVSLALAVLISVVPGARAQAPPPGTERAKIEWNKNNDMDLHVFDDAGNEAFYGNPAAIPEATLSSDVTSTGGPETFTDQQDPSTRHFRYQVCYFSEGVAPEDQGPTQVTVTLSDPGQPQRITTYTIDPLAPDGSRNCVEVGESQAAPAPAPTPTPTPAPQQNGPPPPTQGSTVNVGVVRGTIRFKRRGSSKYEELVGSEQIPIGSTVDATKGGVRLTSAADKNGATKTADFSKGAFVAKQSKSSALTELKLDGGNFASCPKAGKASTSAKKKTIRRLFGSGKGAFRTTGRHAAATVRGTKWLTEDRCDGTFVHVTTGTVTVRDLVKKKNVTVKKGHSYLARAR